MRVVLQLRHTQSSTEEKAETLKTERLKQEVPPMVPWCRDAANPDCRVPKLLLSVSGAMKWIFFGRNENARESGGFSSRFP
jgi:hypothetical protein